MPIINAFPESGGGGGSLPSDAKIAVLEASLYPSIGSSATSVPTVYSYCSVTQSSIVLLCVKTSSNTADVIASVTFVALNDISVTFTGSSSGSTSLTKGHQYRIMYDYSYTTSRQYSFKITDLTNNTDLIAITPSSASYTNRIITVTLS